MKTLDELLQTNVIKKLHYDFYIMFGMTDYGRQLLDKVLISVCMEETPDATGEGFAFKDGRISILRDIKNCIEEIDNLLGDNHSKNIDKQGALLNDGNAEPITFGPTDFSESIPGSL